jgi:ribonuclease VapC
MTAAERRSLSEIVLDASALMAVLREESGSEAVEPVLAEAVIGAVNLSEVYAKLAERGMPDEAIWATVGALDLPVVGFDEEMARLTAGLRPATRRLGLSFGDRACLALGRKLKLPVLTADRAWSRVDVGVDVRVIR